MEQKEPEKWLKIEIEAPAIMMDALANYLTEKGAQGVYQETVESQGEGDFPLTAADETIKAFFPEDVRSEKRVAAIQKYLQSLEEIFPDLEKASLHTQIITDPDWGEQWKKYFKPVRVSNNIIIKPTWERYSPASRDIVIEIDPGMAFGTGQHASTRMCIEAIEDVIMKDRSVESWRALDVGCGTGILGITAAKLGAQEVICVDIDKKAVEIARENAAINAVDSRVRIINGDATAITAEPRNLIIANLTAKLLIKLSHSLAERLLPEGYMIISGIIEQDIPHIEERFLTSDLIVQRQLKENEWICYVLRKKA
ncbi:MAG TPA: 50S ribosomal protein L11 methyltransferase [Smithellaceae bacterium]|nr:50S ribosomal protein L11 methyltransferase [Smithellaceae bacterium]